jgi:hypothetical protein
LASGPDNGWGYDPYLDPTAGLRQAVDQRIAACRDGRLAAGGECLVARQLAQLRARMTEPVRVTSRERFVQEMAVAAQLAANAERFETIWHSRRQYVAHLEKRQGRGEVRDADDYRATLMRTLQAAELVLVATAPGYPTQIAIESSAWAIIYRDAALWTAYPKRADEEAFITQRTRLGWTIGEVAVDDEIRAALRQLRQGYAQLRR